MEPILFDRDFESMNDAVYWNFRAKDYSEATSAKLDPPEEKAEIIQELLRQNIISRDSRVLDLACGPGWYTRAFSMEVREVTGIDISENMLDYARANNQDRDNVSFYQMDWSSADVSQLGKFDLVFANMCPAVYDAATLEKMMAVCRGYCWYAHFARRYCNLSGCLDEYYKKERKLERIRLMFDYLWEQGYLPEVHFQRKGGTPGKRELREAIDYYRHEYHYSEQEDEKIAMLFRQFQQADGSLEYISWFDKGIMCWKV